MAIARKEEFPNKDLILADWCGGPRSHFCINRKNYEKFMKALLILAQKFHNNSGHVIRQDVT